ncbi:hypothetical protein PSA7680_02753 [Pseudoruegeria aquimaris]|uniref:Holin-X, holin superfamily III n=1 Tax=Pseudoruegeria aquimaris TaxID=393663 RepID=A0A1Y5SZT0_9RHOB|nr:hypothetical protein [Pseudoruegeria aquimaris]SLN52483.1 hypothetical protein PSA7680_02753 [Pseudoruegeria aquimaris]
MKRVVRNLTIILRCESLIARRRLAVARRQIVFIAFAGLVAVLGLVMLNVAAYQALAASLGAPLAAFLVALGNFAVAGVLALLAGREDAEGDVAAVAEVRDMAVADLEAELELAQEEVLAVVGDLRRIGRDPLGAASGLAMPLLAALLKHLGKSK